MHKAPGPNGLSTMVLEECSSENAHILALLYTAESVAQGTVPEGRQQANAALDFYETIMLLQLSTGI